VGLDVSVDLIYGAPGETPEDWEASVRAASGLGVDHVSIYALTLEPNVPLARAIWAGRVAPVDEDREADSYELADRLLGAAGLRWYEISNFARPGHASRHNLGYWTGGDWWGIGPGAHSGFGGQGPDVGPGTGGTAPGRESGAATGAAPDPPTVRFWNLKSPARWAQTLAAGSLPVAGSDRPDAAGRALERIMLRLRVASGLALQELAPAGLAAVPRLVADGLLEAGPARAGRARLTRRGRLLADTVIRALAA
jgi:oxygen-independent coproporphyrinogen-3 oxidase